MCLLNGWPFGYGLSSLTKAGLWHLFRLQKTEQQLNFRGRDPTRYPLISLAPQLPVRRMAVSAGTEALNELVNAQSLPWRSQSLARTSVWSGVETEPA